MYHLTERVRLPVDLAGTPESQPTGRNTDPVIGNFFINKRSIVQNIDGTSPLALDSTQKSEYDQCPRAKPARIQILRK
jgi:hypothetical protein